MSTEGFLMTSSRQALINTLWSGIEPFGSKPARPADHQGWASDNPLLVRAIDEVHPRLVVEIGVWKGGSVITMAERMKTLGLDGVILAVDTWLGSSEHWLTPEWLPSLGLEHGYPTLYRTFEANIIDKSLVDYVVPLPLDASNALHVVKSAGITIDVLHIDGSHDYNSVIADLSGWWPLLNVGGVLLGDDYYTDGITWPQVFAAFNDFFKSPLLENDGGKCWIRKTGP